MKIKTLHIAIKKAENFVLIATKAEERWQDDYQADAERLGLTHPESYQNVSKENATCKRASMDLTRILADLRQGR